jgi:hypothetical protein
VELIFRIKGHETHAVLCCKFQGFRPLNRIGKDHPFGFNAKIEHHLYFLNRSHVKSGAVISQAFEYIRMRIGLDCVKWFHAGQQTLEFFHLLEQQAFADQEKRGAVFFRQRNDRSFEFLFCLLHTGSMIGRTSVGDQICIERFKRTADVPDTEFQLIVLFEQSVHVLIEHF